MYLKKVTLKNFGPHQDFSCDLGPGLIGIVGSNGSGKSTLVNAIYACLTNDFSRFEGRKNGVVNDKAGEEESCFVEVEGEHVGLKFTLRRSIKPNSSRLELGDLVYRKQTDIEQHLIKDLGLTRKIVDSYVFVSQWGMFDFLSHTPAKRAEAFSYLCKTEKADKLHKACSSFLQSSVFSSEVLDNRIDIELQIAECEKEIESLTNELQESQKSLLSEEVVTSLTEKIDAFKQLSSFRSRIKTLQENIDEHRETLSESKEEALHQAKVKASLVPLVLSKEKAESYAAAVSSYEAYSTAEAAIELLEERIAIIQAEEPVFRPLTVDLEVCPTCNQEISNEQAKDIHRKKHEQELASWKQNFTRAEAELVALQSSLPKPMCDDAEYSRVKSLLEQSRSAVNDINVCNTKIEGLKKHATTVKQNLTAYKTELGKLSLAIADESLLDYNEEKAQADRKMLTQNQDLWDSCNFIQGQIKAEKTSLRKSTSLLESLEEKLGNEEKSKELQEIVEEVKNLFYWGELPLQVSLANLALIVSELNIALDDFGSPFWVEADDKLNFVVHFPGAPPRLAGSLSGGQKVILAICFRAAVNKIFGNDVGMMFLDEPSAGLDADNLASFKRMLERMATSIKNDFQLFVITHEDSLSSSFTQTLDLCSDERIT